MRVTFIYLFNLGGNPFEDTTDHTEIPQMCLIETDGDDSDVYFFCNFHVIQKSQNELIFLCLLHLLFSHTDSTNKIMPSTSGWKMC